MYGYKREKSNTDCTTQKKMCCDFRLEVVSCLVLSLRVLRKWIGILIIHIRVV